MSTALAELILGDDLNWTAGALCAEIDPDLWHPEKGGNNAAVAKAICHTCPLLTECRDYALARPDITGVWGGMSEQQRRRYHEQERRDAAWPPSSSNKTPPICHSSRRG